MTDEAVLIIHQNRRIKKTTQPVYGNWLRDVKNWSAWFTYRHYYLWFDQFKNKFGGKVRVGLVIDSIYALPLNPYVNREEEEVKKQVDLNRRLVESFEIAAGQAEKEGRRNIMAWGMTLAITGLVFIVIVLALLAASGRLNSA